VNSEQLSEAVELL